MNRTKQTELFNDITSDLGLSIDDDFNEYRAIITLAYIKGKQEAEYKQTASDACNDISKHTTMTGSMMFSMIELYHEWLEVESLPQGYSADELHLQTELTELQKETAETYSKLWELLEL